MGFIEKLKNAFKKKNKGEGAPAAEAAAPKKTKGAPAKRSAQFADVPGDVGKSLRFAADKIDEKVEKGMTERSAEIFMGGLLSIQADTASSDEAKLIAISQVIGGIINA